MYAVRITLALACAACGAEDAPELSSDPSDIGISDAAVPCTPPPFVQTTRLSELGLYTDMASKRMACDLLTWTPRFPLWSDGAEKHRWLRLPGGASIRSDDPEHFTFPVGSVLFKEFKLGDKRLETRVIARISEQDTFFGAFLWREDESDADLIHDGMPNVRGTAHDVPTDEQCMLCHKGEPGRVLGLSAVQTPDFPRLSHPVTKLEVEPALGYLHGNCGHCHNENGEGWRMSSMVLRLSAIEGARPLRDSVGVETRMPFLGTTRRIAPGDPEASALIARMQVRGSDDAMPPVASEQTDPEGLAQVRAWIAGLSAGSAP